MFYGFVCPLTAQRRAFIYYFKFITVTGTFLIVFFIENAVRDAVFADLVYSSLSSTHRMLWYSSVVGAWSPKFINWSPR